MDAPPQVIRGLVSTVTVIALLAGTPVASGKGLCARGRFQLAGATGRHAAVLGTAVLALDRGTAALEGICPGADVDRSYYYGQWQHRTRLRWTTCAPALPPGRMRLHFVGTGCDTLKGQFRSARGRTRFVADRLPTCGNEMLEDGEECDDGNLADGDCCSGACRIEAGCTGACERTADCHPYAVCARASVPAGVCPAAPGTCTPLPPDARRRMCPPPGPLGIGQCGCDGRHYASLCDAWAAGIAVVGPGRCACRLPDGLECPAGYWCDIAYPWYTCDDRLAGTRTGECVEPDASCDGADPAPVCGCDGKTYANDCVRRNARVRADWAGACATP